MSIIFVFRRNFQDQLRMEGSARHMPTTPSMRGPSRRASSPAQKACTLGLRARQAVLIATCSWPWSSLPKSWRSVSSGSGRRRRSSSKSYSCLSLRNRPFCSPAAQSRGSGPHRSAASLVPRGRGTAPRMHAANSSCPSFCRGAGPGTPRPIHDTPPGRGWGPAGPFSRLRGGEHCHFPLDVLACRSRFYYYQL